MPRIKELSRAQARVETQESYDRVFGPGRDPVAEPGTRTGTPGNWHTVWAQTPDIMKAFTAFKSAEAKLDGKLRELALMRAGYARGSQFVFSQHCKVARIVGVDEAKIRAIPYWNVADVYGPAERAVLAYADALVLEGGRVHEGLFARLKSHLSDVEVLELSFMVKMYDLHASCCRALKLEYDDVPERVAEVPQPESQSVQDWTNPAWARAGESIA